jgi:hypothetical protein
MFLKFHFFDFIVLFSCFNLIFLFFNKKEKLFISKEKKKKELKQGTLYYMLEETVNNYTWILLVGVVVFLFVIVVLLCFTRGSGEQLFLTEDSLFEDTIVETPAIMASLSEDARLSYEQAKCKNGWTDCI